MKTLPAAVTTAIAGQEIWPVRLLNIQIGDTTYYISDHYLSLTSGGNTYLPNGNLLNIDNVKDVARADDDSIEVSLSVLEAAFRADIIAADAIGGHVNIFRGLINSDTGLLVADPFLLYSGIIYSVSISEEYPMELGRGVQTATAFNAVVDVRASTFRLNEQPGRFTNDNSWRQGDAGDKSAEFVAGLNGRNIRFGGSAD